MQAGQELANPWDPYTGKKVGDYILHELIGQGTYGGVFRAVKSNGGVYAMKIISRAGMLDQNKQPTKLQDQFNKEVDIMRMIDHPKIIKLREKLQSGNNYYLVLDYCEDGDLKQYIQRRTRMPEGDAIEALKQLAVGFKELHRLGIMHRDFKPANVFIHKGNFIIGDLGMAKQAAITVTKVGTPITMAPEVREAMAIGGQRMYDSTVDLFSLGVTFYYMLYGHWPWKLDVYLPVKMKTDIGKNLPFPDNDDEVSSEVKNLLRKMIALRQDRMDWPDLFLEVEKLSNRPKTFLGGRPDEKANHDLFLAEVAEAKALRNQPGSQRGDKLEMAGDDEVRLEDVQRKHAQKLSNPNVVDAVKKLAESHRIEAIQRSPEDQPEVLYWQAYIAHHKAMIEFWIQQGNFMRNMWKERNLFPQDFMDVLTPAYVALSNKTHLYLANLIGLLKGVIKGTNPSMDSYRNTNQAMVALEDLARFDKHMEHTFGTAKKALEMELSQKHSEFAKECQRLVTSGTTTVKMLNKFCEQAVAKMLKLMIPTDQLKSEQWNDPVISKQVIAFLRVYQMTWDLEEFPQKTLDKDPFDWTKMVKRHVTPPEVKGIYYKARGRLLP